MRPGPLHSRTGETLRPRNGNTESPDAGCRKKAGEKTGVGDDPTLLCLPCDLRGEAPDRRPLGESRDMPGVFRPGDGADRAGTVLFNPCPGRRKAVWTVIAFVVGVIVGGFVMAIFASGAKTPPPFPPARGSGRSSRPSWPSCSFSGIESHTIPGLVGPCNGRGVPGLRG